MGLPVPKNDARAKYLYEVIIQKGRALDKVSEKLKEFQKALLKIEGEYKEAVRAYDAYQKGNKK